MKVFRLASLFAALSFTIAIKALAQPVLPEVGAVTEKGINILSWTNPYQNGVKSVSVQRSADSALSFATVGLVSNISKPVQSFVDAHPMPGNNYYRITLTFNSDVEWKSNTVLLHVDSAAIANQQALPPNDTLQKIIGEMGTTNVNVQSLNTVTYPRSQYVYTNPFSGNINIELSDPFKQHYYILFFDQGGKQVLKIPRVNDTTVVLDKRNFQKSGVYKFTVFKNNQEFEKGYITIY